MPTYVYETIPGKPGEKSLRFEVQQGMMDAPLKTDPETGIPVRRVITGGLEIPRGGSDSSQPHQKPSGGCGSGCGCH